MLVKETPKQRMRTFPIVPHGDLDEILNPKSPRCPFFRYVGNEAAVNIAIRIGKGAFNVCSDIGAGLGRGTHPNWVCTRDFPVRILLTGRRSSGKTEFARCYARLVGTNYMTGQMELPFAEIDGTAISCREEILEKMQQAMREAGVPMIPERTVGAVRHCTMIPSLLFIDEVGSLKKNVQDGILKMCEPNDGIFEAGNYRVDCKHMTIIAATMEPGKLKEALKSRFPIKIALQEHTHENLTKIIQNATNWAKKDAARLATLKPVAREALALAKLINVTCANERCSVDHAITLNAKDLGLDESGLSQSAINVLMALADAQPMGLSKKNICVKCGNMDVSEFEMEIIPQLLRHPALISVSSRHKITDSGLDELRTRNLIDY